MKKIMWIALAILLGAIIYPLIVRAKTVNVETPIVSHVTAIPNDFLPLQAISLSDESLISLEFQDTPVMVRIAKAESRFNCKAKNPNSTAKGCFQILDSTWRGYKCVGDVLNALDNIKCARVIYTQSGTSPWNESKNSWNK